MGVYPESPDYSDDPTAHPGSELDQQFRSIEPARLRILKNKRKIDNLRRQVRIEINKAADISNTIIRYGNKQASLTQRIGDINAAGPPPPSSNCATPMSWRCSTWPWMTSKVLDNCPRTIISTGSPCGTIFLVTP